MRSRLLRLRSLWEEIRQRAEEREAKLSDVLDLAEKFWADMAALLSTLRDSQDIVRELEDPGVDPSLIKQQIEAAEVRGGCGRGRGWGGLWIWDLPAGGDAVKTRLPTEQRFFGF